MTEQFSAIIFLQQQQQQQQQAGASSSSSSSGEATAHECSQHPPTAPYECGQSEPAHTMQDGWMDGWMDDMWTEKHLFFILVPVLYLTITNSD
jgi:hypothetical protein